MSADPLRSTLDQLALDPDAGTDRHYLITVLRRLGYTESEIRRVMGDGEEGRIIEVEYVGSDASSFTFGDPGSEAAAAAAIQGGQGALQFTVSGDDEPMQFTLAGDQAAGTETFESVELGDGDISDDWGDDWGGDAPTDDFVDEGVMEEGGFSVESPPSDDEVEFTEVPLVEFKEKPSRAPEKAWIPVDDDEWGPIEEAPGGAWDATEAEPEWDLDAEPEEDSDEAYVHDGYTLYSRPVELTTGKTQQIYFFAKSQPKSGEPSAMPDGYEVGVSEKTGLPFLRKASNAAVKSQCAALTADDDQCRLTAQSGNEYCHVHQDYIPPTRQEMSDRLDTEPYWADVEDTLPGAQGEGRQQCAAITAAGHQCRNTARDRSKYCASHKGYRPHSPVRDTDTLPVGKSVKDTLPSVRDDAWERAHPGAEPASQDALDTWDDVESDAWPDAKTTTFGVESGREPEPDTQPRRKAPASQPQTRIRMERVKAGSRKDAEREIARRGGKVRGVVPIRLEESEVQDE